ncbi:hypothetical protein [Shewanella surugensis]|uniref:Uncharacterized protein n=1 Tax=Shewanella surugensis TaxID=212020 RepID=A0ABT0LEV0_9GAMM|nr:hypothetical protein [Shewanella surugensis]MCL1126228.1 hypothetical protein [Shewanella surugensis]
MKYLSVFVLCLSFSSLSVKAYQQEAYQQEIAGAKEAAPLHITNDASYMIWEKERFVQKIQGKNEFVCLVLRDGKGRYEPSCLNKAAMNSVFPVYEYQTAMLAKGMSIQDIFNNINVMSASKKLPAPDPGAVVYMMSPNNKFYDHFSQKLLDVAQHIMLYLSKVEASSLGFTLGINNEQGLPMFYDEYPHLSVIHLSTH